MIRARTRALLRPSRKLISLNKNALFTMGYAVAGYAFPQSTTLKPTISFDGETHVLSEIIVRLADTEYDEEELGQTSLK